MRVRNKTGQALAFPNIPAFQPHEVREVSEEQGAYILGNDNFELVEEEPSKNTPKKASEEEASIKGVDRVEGKKL